MTISESALVNDTFDEEECGMNSFPIQPYQFESRRNSDKNESDNESKSGEEGVKEMQICGW